MVDLFFSLFFIARANQKIPRPLKFFIHLSKLQAATSNDDHHTESQLIRAITGQRPTAACSGHLELRKKAGVKPEETGTYVTGV
jgi:hypothetical protein